MKALRLIALLFVMFLPSHAFSEDPGALRITLLEGDVFTYNDDDWIAATVNMPLGEDDTLWTAEDGRTELRVRGGAFVRLDETSLIEVLEVGDESMRLFLEEGRLYVNNERSGYEYIEIDSSFSSVRIHDGSIAMVDVSESGAARVAVLKGSVYSQSTSGGVRVNAGSSVSVGDALYADTSPLGEPGEWERWNRQRDKVLQGPFESARYLPEELNEYAYDFDENGRWIYVKEHGHVWTPTVSISIGWAPYRHGRWKWIRGNYVWISHERWGWAPYHYGRWAHVSHIGWCWVPPRHREVYWGPGFVAWVYTSTYVSWVPLAPREIYYGYGYYGPYSVNLVNINININKTVINRVHKNVHVKNAVTVVHRDTFLTGKKADLKLRHRPFVTDKPSLKPYTAMLERQKPDMKKRKRLLQSKERPAFKPAPLKRKKSYERPHAPGQDIGKREPKRTVKPERQGPVRKFETPARKDRRDTPHKTIGAKKQSPPPVGSTAPDIKGRQHGKSNNTARQLKQGAQARALKVLPAARPGTRNKGFHNL
jgi:hypothetical protein